MFLIFFKISHDKLWRLVALKAHGTGRVGGAAGVSVDLKATVSQGSLVRKANYSSAGQRFRLTQGFVFRHKKSRFRMRHTVHYLDESG